VYARTNAYTGSAIPWAWINAFQARTGGSYGFTQGTQSGSPVSRTRTIEQDAAILDEIIGLSETGAGFDFNIDTQREYNEWHTQRGTATGVVLQYGVNVRTFDYEASTAPGEIVTDVRVYGPANSGNPRTASDALARGLYGRREASLTYMSESEAATVTAGQLQSFADASLGRSAPLIVPQVELVAEHPSIEFGSYWLGDTITFQARLGDFVNIDAQYRIVAVHVELDANDNETIKLDLNAV